MRFPPLAWIRERWEPEQQHALLTDDAGNYRSGHGLTSLATWATSQEQSRASDCRLIRVVPVNRLSLPQSAADPPRLMAHRLVPPARCPSARKSNVVQPQLTTAVRQPAEARHRAGASPVTMISS
jgi:hypothetical protein